TEIDGPHIAQRRWLDSIETIPFDPSMRVNEASGSITRDSAMRISASQIVGEGTPPRAVPPVRVDSFRPEPTARQVRRAQGTPRPARAPARHPHDNVPTRLNHVDIAGGHISYSPDPEAYPTPVPLPPLPVAAKHTPRPLHAPYGAPALPPHVPTAMAVPPQAIMPTQIAQPLPAQLPTQVAQQLPALVRPYRDGVTPYPVPPWATGAHPVQQPPPPPMQQSGALLDIYDDTDERRGDPTHHVAALPMPTQTPSLRPPISRYLLPMIGGTALLVFVAGYFLVRGDDAKRPETAPIASAAVMPVVAPVPVVSEIVEPQLPEPSWKHREAQPTIVAKTDAVVEPTVEPVAEPAADIEMAPMVAKKKKSSSSSARRAKRAQVAAIEAPKAKPVKAAKKPASQKAAKTAKAERDPILEEIERPSRSSQPKATGPGKLRISSSVPTLIYVDGRSTNLMTPKTLNLSPGTHKITLLELKSKKAKTLDVDITSGSVTNVDKKF
ncbi:MAG: hypothetical protein AB7L94_43690, partial [Kofleriaceae bacterium]